MSLAGLADLLFLCALVAAPVLAWRSQVLCGRRLAIFFAALWLSQVLGPAPIRKANGAMGSVWASYTPGEISTWLAASPFQGGSVRGRFGWFFASVRKKPLKP